MLSEYIHDLQAKRMLHMTDAINGEFVNAYVEELREGQNHF